MSVVQVVECDRAGCGDRAPLIENAMGLHVNVPEGWASLIQVVKMPDGSLLETGITDMGNKHHLCPACIERALV